MAYKNPIFPLQIDERSEVWNCHGDPVDDFILKVGTTESTSTKSNKCIMIFLHLIFAWQMKFSVAEVCCRFPKHEVLSYEFSWPSDRWFFLNSLCVLAAINCTLMRSQLLSWMKKSIQESAILLNFKTTHSKGSKSHVVLHWWIRLWVLMGKCALYQRKVYTYQYMRGFLQWLLSR